MVKSIRCKLLSRLCHQFILKSSEHDTLKPKILDKIGLISSSIGSAGSATIDISTLVISSTYHKIISYDQFWIKITSYKMSFKINVHIKPIQIFLPIYKHWPVLQRNHQKDLTKLLCLFWWMTDHLYCHQSGCLSHLMQMLPLKWLYPVHRPW